MTRIRFLCQNRIRSVHRSGTQHLLIGFSCSGGDLGQIWFVRGLTGRSHSFVLVTSNNLLFQFCLIWLVFFLHQAHRFLHVSGHGLWRSPQPAWRILSISCTCVSQNVNLSRQTAPDCQETHLRKAGLSRRDFPELTYVFSLLLSLNPCLPEFPFTRKLSETVNCVIQLFIYTHLRRVQIVGKLPLVPSHFVLWC